MFADLRVVSFTQRNYKIMCAGGFSRSDDVLRLGFGIESRDIFRNGSPKQFDVLREITNVTSQVVGRPLIQVSAVQADTSRERLPYPDNGSEQRRLSGA